MGQGPGAGDILGQPDDGIGLQGAAEGVGHAAPDDADGQVGNVNADPAAVETLGGGHGRSAAAEGIQHHIAFGTAGGDDAFQQGLRFLRGVAEAFTRLGAEGRYVGNDVLDEDAGALVGVPLLLRYGTARRPVDVSGLIQQIQPFLRGKFRQVDIGVQGAQGAHRHCPVAARIRRIYAAPGRAGLAGSGSRSCKGDQTIAPLIVLKAVVSGQIFSVIILIHAVPGVVAGCPVKQDNVVYRPPPFGSAVRPGSFPHYFVPEIADAEHAVHHQLQVMAGGGVAVQVDAAGGFQDAAQFNHPLGHHGEVGHHVVLAQEGAHCGQQFAGLGRPGGDYVAVSQLRVPAPAPGVVKGGDLRRRGVAAAFPEQHIVGGVRVEGRVQVNQVNAGVGDLFPQYGEVVAVVEPVRGGLRRHSSRLHRRQRRSVSGIIADRPSGARRAAGVGIGAGQSARRRRSPTGKRRPGGRDAKPPPGIGWPSAQLRSAPGGAGTTC